MNKQLRLKWLGAILLLIVGVYLYVGIEIYEEPTTRQTNAEVRKQPFLAAQMLMQMRDVDVSIYSDYKLLFAESDDRVDPGFDDVVVMTDAEVVIPDNTSDILLNWIEQGGHLVLAVTDSGSMGGKRANTLLEKLEVSSTWVEDEVEGLKQMPTTLGSGNSEELKVNLENSYRITLSEEQEVYYAVGPQDYPPADGEENGTTEGWTFVQLDRGEGLITLMTEVDIWSNEQIDEYDNAKLLAFLTDNVTKVHVFSPIELPHWFSLLYEFAPWFVWLGAVLLFAAMWKQAMRFGPTSSELENERTLFAQHIRASGEHYWRTQQQQALLEALRQSLISGCHHKWPVSKSGGKEKTIQLLCETSGWPTDTVESLLFSTQTLNQSQFTEWVKGLQQLRNML